MANNTPNIEIEGPDFFEVIGKYYTKTVVWLLNKFSKKKFIIVGKPGLGTSTFYTISQKTT